MELRAGSVVELVDGLGRLLGHVTVECLEGERLLGQFAAGPGYAAAEPLFRQFEEAANDQVFSILDDLADTIAALQPRFRSANNGAEAAVQDLQIMEGHDLSCKLYARPTIGGLAGAAGKTSSR